MKARSLLPLVLLLQAPAQAAEPDLGTAITDPAQIRALMTGNTLGGVFEQTGEPWAEYYCDTGKSLYDFHNRISLGKWWVERQQVCFTYDWSQYQHVQCFAMFERKDRGLSLVAQDVDTGEIMTFSSQPPIAGDPYHLEQRAVQGCRPQPSV
jgi:hypothetical protein